MTNYETPKHDPIARIYYLLAISGTVAAFFTWLLHDARDWLEQVRRPAPDVPAPGTGAGLVAFLSTTNSIVFLIAFCVAFGTGYLALRTRSTLRRFGLAHEHGFYVAAVFSDVLIRLADATAEMRKAARGRKSDQDAIDQFIRQEKPTLILLLNQIARFFTLYTGRECCASLKLFQVENGERTERIYTPVRDDQPASTRRQIVDVQHPFYSYRENTAFDLIMNDAEIRWYVNNNLPREAKRGRYINSREGWQADYTATLVVPITDQHEASAIDKRNIIGFLCVDNKGGGFDEHFCANVSFAFARITHGFLKTFLKTPNGNGR